MSKKKTYSVCIGAYIRGYSTFEVQATSDEKAIAAAIAKAKAEECDFDEDMDYSNVALPAIAHIFLKDDDTRTAPIVEGLDFALTEQDALDMASKDLLAALRKAERLLVHLQGTQEMPPSPEYVSEVRRECLEAIKKATTV
jgi:hypothetical protein